ncbi:aldose epimerase family protein [Chitinimonas sp.]|uniref:aldose epimerase family protein n=1 Tax=Chitinimonas sp. TaxID=1934313 RepID=UPI002F94204D
MTSYPVTTQDWGNYRLFQLRNAQDMRVLISDLGATLVSWHAPDRSGRLADILLGHAGPEGYENNGPYFGSQVGRWANRIRDGRFTLDGVPYQVDRNQGGQHHLHGGHAGFHQQVWAVAASDGGLVFSLQSAEGEAGFPGTLRVEVRYSLDDDGTLRMDYQAVSDAPTPISLTAHPYFNLNGGEADIGDHLLQIAADQYLQVDESLIPVARCAVAGSAFDFLQPAPIGARLAWPDGQLAIAGGFDHCYCLNGGTQALRPVAEVYDPTSGRELRVSTTEPGLQFYSGNFLDGAEGRRRYRAHDGFCLEAQRYPDQVNGPDAEAAILRPGQRYQQTTCYRLGVRR